MNASIIIEREAERDKPGETGTPATTPDLKDLTMANAPQNTKAKGTVRDIVVGPHRLAFLHLTQPNGGGQYPSHKYEAHALIPKDDAPTLALLRSKALEAARQLWPGIEAKELTIGIRDGDEKANLEGFPSHWFINAKSKNPVPVYGPAREVLPADGVKSGDFARVCITAGAYRKNLEPEVGKDLIAAGRKVIVEKDAETGKVAYFRPAVTFYLNAVQLVKRGTGFGGGAANPNVFPVEGASGEEPAPGADVFG